MSVNTVALLADLIAFPTVSSVSNLDLIGFAQAHLEKSGARCRRVHGPAGKAGLLATIGPDVAGGVVLSGHTDVVPVEGQSWSTDPFTLTERAGRLHARGTCDMKGFLAAALAAAPAMAAARLARPVHFALSFDEEIGCLGAPMLIAALLEHVPRPAAVIVGEPSGMGVVTAHKGCVEFTTTVRGHATHASLAPRTVSAVAVAARLVNWLNDRQAAVAAAAAADGTSPFEPPFTTIHCGMIEGGIASNIVAARCRFTTDIRCVDTDTAEPHLAAFRAETQALLPTMRALAPDSGIDIVLDMDVPPLRREAGGTAEALARRFTGDAGARTLAAVTEAGQFQAAGLSTVVCGPGSIEQAHQPDEFVTLDQLAAADRFMAQLTNWSSV